MRIILRYFDGCPHWRLAEQRLAEAMIGTDVGRREVVHEIIATPEQAERLGFTGSPSILFDGHDPFAADAPAVGLACRVYRTDNGPQGAPSLAQLRAALCNETLFRSCSGGAA